MLNTYLYKFKKIVFKQILKLNNLYRGLLIMKNEQQIENEFIKKLIDLKYVYREDIRDKFSLEENFRKHFED